VNVSRVKPYLSALDGQPVNRPGLQRVTNEGDVEYKVEYVVDSHLKRGALQFLVHWRGYPEEDRTWELASTLKNSHLFTPVLEPFTTVHPIWSCLEVKP
ncbi:hypothetical protein M404DRAFT_74751, partial [Pisolithus tinctorius Marx 270]